MKRIKQRKERYSLSAETIDALALVCSEALLEADTDKKDIIRIRISLEEILSVLLSALGEGEACFCRTGSRFGRQFIEIRVKGEKIDLQEQDEPGLDEFMYGRLMAEAGLSLVYTYKDGANCLTGNPPGKARLSQMAQLSIAIAGAVICGLICTFLPEAAQDGPVSYTHL